MRSETKSSILQHSVTEVRAVIESQFEELQAVVDRAKREVTEILEGEEKQALRQAEGIRVHLEQRCTELKKTQAQMEKLSKNKNDVDFLQVTPPGSSPKAKVMPEGCNNPCVLTPEWHHVCSAGVFRVEERDH